MVGTMPNTKEEILGDIQVWQAELAIIREDIVYQNLIRSGTERLRDVEKKMAKVLADNTKKRDAFWFRIIMERKDRDEFPECPKTVSSEILEPHRKQIERNHGQTLERLNERGGMNPMEIHCAAEYGELRNFSKTNMHDAVKFLIKLNNK